MADPRLRRERLLALLPRIYTAQPATGAVGAIIDSLARALARLDDDLTRAQYDRWAALASGTQPGPDDPSALERLARLLQVTRLPPRVHHTGYSAGEARIDVRFSAAAPLAEALAELVGGADLPDLARATERLAGQFDGLHFSLGDDHQTLGAEPAPDTPPEAQGPALGRFRAVLDPEPDEIFRQRLQVTARVRTGGLTTPRALLSLAIADLGAEPCPQLDRRQDSTLAYGMPPGTRKRCAACGGSAPCPHRGRAVVEAWLTENPVLAASHAEPAPRLHRAFSIASASLHADRPVLTLRALGEPVAFPAVRSIDSGEITVFAGELAPGQSLTLYPACEPAEVAVFDGFDAPAHHAWLRAHPAGHAERVDADGRRHDVSDAVYYLWGNRFDDPGSTLGAMRCGVLAQRVVTPRLHPGNNAWVALTFTRPDADDGPADYATRLFKAFNRTDPSATEAAGSAPRFSLHLDWTTRPPANLRLRIPKNDWVAAAATRGALALLRADVARATAAGVAARVDFPEPARRETVGPAATLGLATTHRWPEDTAPAEHPPALAVAAALRDDHAAADGPFSLRATFDVTRLDWSHAG